MGSKHGPADVRFWLKVRRGDGCWLWLAGTGSTGYGVFGVGTLDGRPRKVYAHRYAYERVVGPIPDGLVLDHLCGQKTCVNPAHLEPTTHAENVRRGGRAHTIPFTEFQPETLF